MGHKKILAALSILTAQDITKLSSLDEEIMAFEQVAGGEWMSPPRPVHRQQEAKVLAFPQSASVKIQEIESLAPQGEEEFDESYNELSLDFILTQRNLWKQLVKSVGTAKAIEGYINQLDLISIREAIVEGKGKVRFISTNGILVNKKQA